MLLARKIYNKSDILVIDDFFDDFPRQLRKRIFENFVNEAYKKRTIIYISGDVDLIKKSDNIIVFEEGCISEEGTYDQLIQDSSSYLHSFEFDAREKRTYRKSGSSLRVSGIEEENLTFGNNLDTYPSESCSRRLSTNNSSSHSINQINAFGRENENHSKSDIEFEESEQTVKKKLGSSFNDFNDESSFENKKKSINCDTITGEERKIHFFEDRQSQNIEENTNLKSQRSISRIIKEEFQYSQQRPEEPEIIISPIANLKRKRNINPNLSPWNLIDNKKYDSSSSEKSNIDDVNREEVNQSGINSNIKEDNSPKSSAQDFDQYTIHLPFPKFVLNQKKSPKKRILNDSDPFKLQEPRNLSKISSKKKMKIKIPSKLHKNMAKNK